jgi:glutathione S-transferase
LRAKQTADGRNLSKRLGYVQGILAAHRFLMGAAFTMADAYLYTVLRWSGRAGLDLAQWPAVERYFDEIGARRSVVAALQAEILISSIEERMALR